jgi:hypothetical protein
MVTLASIVEKETGKADERPRVAGVFVNRLQKHMRLESDPTIVYGLVFGKGTLGHPITRDELNRPTAYNTYLIDGLPPGPISNPGKAALEAVANPVRSKDLYFVSEPSLIVNCTPASLSDVGGTSTGINLVNALWSTGAELIGTLVPPSMSAADRLPQPLTPSRHRQVSAFQAHLKLNPSTF